LTRIIEQDTPETLARVEELERALSASQERATTAEARFRRLADDALEAIAGAGICTPEETYRDAPYLLAGDIKRLAKERDAGRKFKGYVHQRLDEAGVPVDPESPHKAEGCRIGGRLDWVFDRQRRMREALETKLAGAVDELRDARALLFASQERERELENQRDCARMEGEEGAEIVSELRAKVAALEADTRYHTATAYRDQLRASQERERRMREALERARDALMEQGHSRYCKAAGSDNARQALCDCGLREQVIDAGAALAPVPETPPTEPFAEVVTVLDGLSVTVKAKRINDAVRMAAKLRALFDEYGCAHPAHDDDCDCGHPPIDESPTPETPPRVTPCIWHDPGCSCPATQETPTVAEIQRATLAPYIALLEGAKSAKVGHIDNELDREFIDALNGRLRAVRAKALGEALDVVQEIIRECSGGDRPQSPGTSVFRIERRTTDLLAKVESPTPETPKAAPPRKPVLRFAVYLPESAAPNQPIAEFEYGDMAQEWAKKNYPGRSRVVDHYSTPEAAPRAPEPRHAGDRDDSDVCARVHPDGDFVCSLEPFHAGPIHAAHIGNNLSLSPVARWDERGFDLPTEATATATAIRSA
jgi:hypothetical protein